MQIGLSGVIQKRMKGITLQPAEGEELVFCWDTHLIKYRNRNVLLIVNANSRYAIIMTGMGAQDWKYYSTYIHKAIYFALQAEGYSQEQINEYFKRAGDYTITKTHGRKAVSGFNHVGMLIEYLETGLEQNVHYQRELSHIANRDICKPIGFNEYGYPEEFFELDLQRLGIVKEKKSAKIIDLKQYRQVIQHQ